MEREAVINCTVITGDPEKIARAGEALARAAAGLALEGIDVNVHFGWPSDFED